MKNHLLILIMACGIFACNSHENARINNTEIGANIHQKDKRPNVLWILIENIGPEFSSYNYPHIKTPNIDQLATEGALYKKAFTNAPVCSPSRTSLITGMYPNAIGGHHHRSQADLTDSLKTIPELFKEAGYHTSLGNGYIGKTDYNFSAKERNLWDSKDWANRQEGQPFFAQLTINHSHRGMHWHDATNPKSWMHEKYQNLEPISPKEIDLPEVIPDNIYTRDDWAKYLNQIQVVDVLVGQIVDRLKKENLYDNTLIVLMGDNGRDHIRDEYWLYDGGLHVPLIVHWPGKVKAGAIIDDLIGGVDVSASLLNACEIPLPEYLHGIPFLGKNSAKRDYVYGSRDRIDDAYDMVRMVRGQKFKYIRNFMPKRSYSQHRGWLTHVNPAFPLLNYLAVKAPHELNEVQKQYTAKTKPVEELYDVINDPQELNNLAENPSHTKELKKFRGLLKKWMLSIDDKARIPEDPDNVREVSFKKFIEFPSKSEQYNHTKLDEIK